MKSGMDGTLKRLITVTFAISIFFAGCMFFWKGPSWAFGYLTGVFWMLANILLTSEIWKAAFISPAKARVLLIALFKFPVLYVLAYFILVSRYFSGESLVSGLTVVLFVMGGVTIWPKPA